MLVTIRTTEPSSIAKPSRPRSTHRPIKIANSKGARANVAPINPDKVYILIEFSDTDVYGEGQWARFEAIVEDYDFATNRYIVSTKQLQELRKSSTGFNWDSVNTIKVYTSVFVENDVISDDFYVCLDAVRLENVTSINPLYGLVGYSVIKNIDAATVIKESNTTSYIEFRFGMNINNG